VHESTVSSREYRATYTVNSSVANDSAFPDLPFELCIQQRWRFLMAELDASFEAMHEEDGNRRKKKA